MVENKNKKRLLAPKFIRIPRVRIVRFDQIPEGKENSPLHCFKDVGNYSNNDPIKKEPQLPCIFHSEVDLQDTEPSECNVTCTCGDCMYLRENKERMREKLLEEIKKRPMPPLRKLIVTDVFNNESVPIPSTVIYTDAESQTHLKKYKYTCKKCLSQFNNLEFYNHHLTSHLKVFGCAFCSATFTTKAQLRSHHLFHINKKFYECIHCEASFSKKGSLIKHVREHENKNIWSCNICSAKFEKSDYLEMHKRKHLYKSTGALIHVFRKIKSTDSSDNNESMPNITETNLYENTANKGFYFCNKCRNLTFKTQNLLKKHERIHSRKEGVHICEKCAARFSLKIALFRHKKHAH